MTEHEVRQVLEDACEELDRRSVSKGRRRVFLPAVLGAGLILTAAACYGGPFPPPQPAPKPGSQAVLSVEQSVEAEGAELEGGDLAAPVERHLR
jgi:hypothetical protein